VIAAAHRGKKRAKRIKVSDYLPADLRRGAASREAVTITTENVEILRKAFHGAGLGPGDKT